MAPPKPQASNIARATVIGGGTAINRGFPTQIEIYQQMAFKGLNALRKNLGIYTPKETIDEIKDQLRAITTGSLSQKLIAGAELAVNSQLKLVLGPWANWKSAITAAGAGGGIKGLLGLGGKFLGSWWGASIVSSGVIVSLPNIYSFFVQGFYGVWNFNWNATDQELDKQLEQQLLGLYGQLGAVAGSAVGYLVCGALPGTLAFAFNPTLAAAILKDVAEEAKQEVYAQVAAISNTAFRLLMSKVLIESFKGTRRWLKRPGTPMYEALKTALGENFTKWGDAGRPSFTIAGAVDDRVEKIKDERLKRFTEEFLENFGDACIDAGYTVVNSIESYMAAQKLMQDQILGDDQLIEVEVET